MRFALLTVSSPQPLAHGTRSNAGALTDSRRLFETGPRAGWVVGLCPRTAVGSAKGEVSQSVGRSALRDSADGGCWLSRLAEATPRQRTPLRFPHPVAADAYCQL